MAKQDWEKIGQIVENIRELGLSYKDGAKHFGVKPWVVYEYNRERHRRKAVQQDAPAKEEPREDGKAKEERPASLPADVGDLIRGYRREHPSHGFKRIQDNFGLLSSLATSVFGPTSTVTRCQPLSSGGISVVFLVLRILWPTEEPLCHL